MRLILQTFGWLLLGATIGRAAGGEANSISTRELLCRVVDESGAPVRGAAVRLGGLERDAPDFEDDESRVDREPGWKFTTGDAGNFTAHFGCFHPYEFTDRAMAAFTSWSPRKVLRAG